MRRRDSKQHGVSEKKSYMVHEVFWTFFTCTSFIFLQSPLYGRYPNVVAVLEDDEKILCLFVSVLFYWQSFAVILRRFAKYTLAHVNIGQRIIPLSNSTVSQKCSGQCFYDLQFSTMLDWGLQVNMEKEVVMIVACDCNHILWKKIKKIKENVCASVLEYNNRSRYQWS